MGAGAKQKSNGSIADELRVQQGRDLWDVFEAPISKTVQADLRLPDPRSLAEKPCSFTSHTHSSDESEFITAVRRFQEQNKVRFPTVSQYLWIVKQLGYRKV